MLNEIKSGGKTTARIYKGSDLIWQMPEMMYSKFEIAEGYKGVSIKTHPGNATVLLTAYKANGTKEEYKAYSSVEGQVILTLDTAASRGDRFYAKITKIGWAPAEPSITIW